LPVYEYECRSCKARFERLIFDHSVEVICSKCGSTDLSQLLSTFAVSTRTAKAAEPGPCGACGAAQRGMCGLE
jgi:putative FmdB family regulatory protein